MTWLVPQVDAIPPELREQPWVLWRGEDTGGPKPAKVPYCPQAPWRRASSTAPETWADFPTAVEMSRRRPDMTGLAVVLTPDARIACLDLDDCLDDQRQVRKPVVANIVRHCRSWTEISPSGSGLHIFGRGHVRRAVVTPDGFEVYGAARYICITGHRWTPSADLADLQLYLDWLDARFHPPARPRASRPGPAPPDDLAGALVQDLQRWGIAVRRLRPWDSGYAAEITCPWVREHTSGDQGTVAIIHGSGARSFVCRHAHCAHRAWREFYGAVAR